MGKLPPAPLGRIKQQTRCPTTYRQDITENLSAEDVLGTRLLLCLPPYKGTEGFKRLRLPEPHCYVTLNNLKIAAQIPHPAISRALVSLRSGIFGELSMK